MAWLVWVSLTCNISLLLYAPPVPFWLKEQGTMTALVPFGEEELAEPAAGGSAPELRVLLPLVALNLVGCL